MLGGKHTPRNPPRHGRDYSPNTRLKIVSIALK
jgi:hypothetical protein